jgi:hypothetical protein
VLLILPEDSARGAACAKPNAIAVTTAWHICAFPGRVTPGIVENLLAPGARAVTDQRGASRHTMSFRVDGLPAFDFDR